MRGKIAIVVMISLALALAGFAWYWNYQRATRARAFWGERAATIRFAKKVEALRRDSPEESIDISNAPGLLNARTSLMSDDAFDWSRAATSSADDWTVGVRFIHKDNVVTLLFNDQNDRMQVSESGQVIALDAKTAKGWRSYLNERWKAAHSSLNQTSN